MQLALESAGIEPLNTIRLMGLPLHRLDERQTVRLVMDRLEMGKGGWIVTANLDHLRRLVKDPAYRALCAPADLVVADGMPLVWASRLQRTCLPERVAGSSLVWTLTNAAARHNRSIFLIGGAPGTAERAAVIFQRKFPGLRVAGHLCPQLGSPKDSQVFEEIQAQIELTRPDIVYVALGSPKQEKLIVEMKHLFPATWWVGVGISFSFVCGDVKRAPRWVQRLGLEWCHRLVQEPRRLARRYLIDDLPFAFQMFASAIKNRQPKRKVG